jgi:creatinine amidohydrolase/Fe(II)-dependent formamide hydrolase-like protein
VLKLPCVYAATDVVPQPGSLFFRPATTMAVLEDLGRTLAAQGFRDVVVSNFHGSPRHFLALEAACQRVSRRHRIRMVSVFSMMLARFTTGPETLEDVLASFSGVDRSQLAGDTHGGLLETSQLLALHGEWVDPDYKQLPRLTFESWLARAQSGRAREPQGRIRGLLALLRSFRGNVRFFETNSYAGAPAGASAELGERILDALGERSAAALAEVFDGTLSPLECHSPLWRWRFFFLHPWLIRLANRVVGFRNVLA